MLIIPEALIADLVTPEDAFAAIEATLVAMARGKARNVPVVREAPGEGRQYGVKAGGHFPGHAAQGVINHRFSVLLCDPDTGRPVAMVGGNLPTALRTAAASAISIDRLTVPQARNLGIVGAGHQAACQLRAAARVRRFDRVIAWSRHPERLPKLAAVAVTPDLPFQAVDLPEMRAADVILTITSAPAASLMAAHVNPGSHLAGMGTDTRGKQEVDPARVAAGVPDPARIPPPRARC